MLHILMKPIIGLLLLLCVQLGKAGDIRVGKTSMKVSSGGTLSFKSNLLVAADALIINDGGVFVRNDQQCTLNLNTILDGTGVYSITGNDDCVITGNGAAISSLYIGNDHFVNINTDFTISGTLNLDAGIVDVADGYQLKITGTSSDAIIFNDDYNTASFISGTLVRNTEAGNEYAFPLGTVFEGFHPFKAGNLSSSGYITVNYDPNYDDSWNVRDTKIQLEAFGAWQVETDVSGITFSPSLSLFSSTGSLSDFYNLFYIEDAGASTGFVLDNNSGDESGEYLSSLSSYGSGVFAVSQVKMVNEDGNDVPELVNFLVKDGTGRTTFEVPGINNYEKVELSVYNRFGSLVYRSTTYANDFDCRDYPAGTYFYELTLTTPNSRDVLSRNIIEIMEHD